MSFYDFFLPSVKCFVASIAFGVQFNIKPRHLIGAAIGGFGCQLIFIITQATGASEIISCFTAALAITIYAEILARKLRVPVNMYLVVGIIPLVPGRYIYETMITLVDGDIDIFLRSFTDTIAIAGAIAMGVFSASSAVRLLKVRTKI
ncbi:MAG: threonine/serine exporter family protein [Oscillospiraceae bacterium]|nr:threonine/serine exporter family protein [Oscillospiraceae bacterium]